MKTKLLAAALLVIAAAAAPSASDPVGIYAKIDRVTLEPDERAPAAIQVWGVFSMAKPKDRNDYLPPARGYLYFTLPNAAAATRRAMVVSG